MKSIFRTALDFAAGVVLFLAGIIIAYSFFGGSERYYHTILESRIDPDVIHSGDPVVTHVVIDRNAPSGCAVELHRFISEYDTGIVVWSQIAPGVAKDGRETIVRRIIEIPRLQPGLYKYHFRAISTCAGGISLFAQSNGARFEVR